MSPSKADTFPCWWQKGFSDSEHEKGVLLYCKKGPSNAWWPLGTEQAPCQQPQESRSHFGDCEEPSSAQGDISAEDPDLQMRMQPAVP